MINIILWIIFGGFVGWIASIIMRNNEEQGVFGNIIIGILGALIGGFIMRALGEPGVTGFNLPSFLIALGGAVVLLALFQMFRSRSV